MATYTAARTTIPAKRLMMGVTHPAISGWCVIDSATGERDMRAPIRDTEAESADDAASIQLAHDADEHWRSTGRACAG